LQNEHPLQLANFTELDNALTINPILDKLPTTMTYQLPLHLKQRNKTWRSPIILQQVGSTD